MTTAHANVIKEFTHVKPCFPVTANADGTDLSCTTLNLEYPNIGNQRFHSCSAICTDLHKSLYDTRTQRHVCRDVGQIKENAFSVRGIRMLQLNLRC